MAPTKFNSLFAVAFLLLLLAAQSPFAEARKYIGVNQWCRTANHRRLCTRMVNGATTHNDAAMNALKTTLEYAKRLRGMIQMVKSAIAGLDLEKQNTIMTTCTGDLDGNVDDLEKVIAAMQTNDLGVVQSRLSAALGSSSCNATLTDYQVESPFGMYAKLWHKEVDNCLAVIMQN